MSSVEHDSDRRLDLDCPLPEGWALARLGVIADSLTYGYTASATAGSRGPRFLRITDIQDGRVDWDRVPTCPIQEQAIRKYGLVPGDIVFARTGATTGKSFLIRSCPLAVFASYLIRLRLLPEINPALLDYFFQTHDYWTFISDNVAGIAQPNCNATKLSGLQVPIPPSEEQQRLVEAIAVLLSKVGAARDHLSRVPPILKRFRQAVLAAACSGRLTEDWRERNPYPQTGDQLFRDVVGPSPIAIPPESTPIDDLPISWAWATVGEVSSLVTDGDHNPPKRAAAGIPHLTAKSIKKWRINFNNCTFIAHEDFEKTRARYEPREGDLIVTCVGTIGETAIVPEGCVFSADRNLAAIRLKPGALLPTVAQYILNAPPWVDTVREGSSSTAQPHLYLKTLRALIVPLIPLAEQQELVLRVRVLFELADEIEQRVSTATSRADRLTRSILAKAFRGELVPTEAELARCDGRDYEPASVLLDRIRAERASRVNISPNRKLIARKASAHV